VRRELVVIAVAACTRATDAPAPAPAKPPVATNIARADYVGPRVCGDCHANEYARWSQSLHRVMNARSDDDGAVIGDFAAATLHYAGGEAHFTHDRDGYAIDVRRGDKHARYRVTRTIGRRGLQEYVGIEDGHTDEVRLPFGWWPRRGAWYPQPYFDPWLGDEASFDAYAPVREPWAERCPWCHSTYPFAERIARASGPRGVGHGMEQLFAAAPGSSVLAVDEQITTGISCESCHLGGRTHADGGAIHFVPQGATPRDGVLVPVETFAAERSDAQVVNAVCAQCHSGPSPRLPDHTALRNSSEALDLGASPCTNIKCTDCHDPHAASGGKQARADDARAIAACTHCHTALADAAGARSHAGHTTATCLDCHMPKLVMGIDRFVRTHRIGSPTDRAVLAAAGPNACNLCHLDRSIEWTASELARGWDVHLPVASWERAYRELDAPLGETWLASAQPALRLIAAHAYARSPLGKAALPQLVAGLGDSLAYMRVWTLFAVEDVLGRTIPITDFDPRADAATRAHQLRALALRAP
jgi:predicted CXXCH cytochrome family protein